MSTDEPISNDDGAGLVMGETQDGNTTIDRTLPVVEDIDRSDEVIEEDVMEIEAINEQKRLRNVAQLQAEDIEKLQRLLMQKRITLVKQQPKPPRDGKPESKYHLGRVKGWTADVNFVKEMTHRVENLAKLNQKAREVVNAGTNTSGSEPVEINKTLSNISKIMQEETTSFLENALRKTEIESEMDEQDSDEEENTPEVHFDKSIENDSLERKSLQNEWRDRSMNTTFQPEVKNDNNYDKRTLVKACKDNMPKFGKDIADVIKAKAFLSRLEDLIDEAEWNEEIALRVIPSFLEGSAYDWFKDWRRNLSKTAEIISFDDFVKAFKNEYIPDFYKKAQFKKLFQVRKGSRTVAQVCEEIERIIRDTESIVDERLRINILTTALSSEEQKHLSLRDPETFREAKNIAIHYENVCGISGRSFNREVAAASMEAEAPKPKAAPFRRPYRCFRCGLKDHRLENCKFKESVCYECQDPGHRYKDCPKRSDKPAKGEVCLSESLTRTIPSPDHLRTQSIEEKLGSNETIKVNAKIGSTATQILIDTGCNVSLLKRELISRLPDGIVQIIWDNIPNGIQTVDPSKPGLSIVGFARISLTIGTTTQNVLVCLIDRMNYDLILGTDYMNTLIHSINMNKNQLEMLRGPAVPFNHLGKLNEPRTYSGKTSEIRLLKVKNEIVLKPKCIIDVPVELYPSPKEQEITILIDPLTHPPCVQQQVDVFGTVRKYEKNVTHAALIFNYSDRTVKLEKDHILARWTLIERNEEDDTYDLLPSNNGPRAMRRDVEDDEEHRRKVLEQVKIADGENEDFRVKIQDLVAKFHDVFALETTELTTITGYQHKIDLIPGSEPHRTPPYRMGPEVDDKVRKEIDNMKSHGFISPANSDWASGVTMVSKKDGSLRFCVDYRNLNSKTRKDTYPLPRIDEILDHLGGKTIFSSLDLAAGYWQIEVKPEDRYLTTFTTKWGTYEFNVMPFGLCNAPGTFQRMMDDLLRGLTWINCMVYLDDIIVYSKCIDEHIRSLEQIFTRLRCIKAHMKIKKCEFIQPRLTYLGHVIAKEGIAPNPEKVKAVEEFPVPIDKTTVRQFLGLAGYYRRFVKGFSQIAKPMNLLLQDDVKWHWSKEANSAFVKLKNRLMEAPILAYPQFDRDFIVQTDASIDGLGAVLSQKDDDKKEHVIAYASRTTIAAERNYCITDLEGLAVVWAVNQFRPYLYGRHFEIWVDHSALRSILEEKRSIVPRRARWQALLSSFDYEIKHRSGKLNNNADALSRQPLPIAELTSWDELQGEDLDQYMLDYDMDQRPDVKEQHNLECFVSKNDRIRNYIQFVQAQAQLDTHDIIRMRQRKDPELCEIQQYLETQEMPDNLNKEQRIQFDLAKKHLCLARGIIVLRDRSTLEEIPKLYKGELIWVPPKNERTTILEENHDCAGHYSETRTLTRIQSQYWWPHMSRDVRDFVRTCDACQRNQQRTMDQVALQSMPIPERPMQIVGIDHLQLPFTGKYQYALVIMDHYSKWPEVYPCETKNMEEVITLLRRFYLPRFGPPQTMISDQAFKTELTMQMALTEDFKIVRTSAYHPQTNGMVERFNKTLIAGLKKLTTDNGLDWPEHLPEVLRAYRSTVHSVTLETPHYLLYVEEAPEIRSNLSLTWPELVTSLSNSEIQRLQKRIELQKIIKNRMRASQKMNRQERERRNHKTKAEGFREGDQVMIYNFHVPDQIRGAHKLFARWSGPYRIVKTHPPVLYEVRTVKRSALVTTMIHRIRLKRYHPRKTYDSIVETDEDLERDGFIPLSHTGKTESEVKKWIEEREQWKQQRKDAMTTQETWEEEDPDAEYEVERILNHRVKKQGEESWIEYKVRWDSTKYTMADDMWVKAEDMQCNDLIAEYLQKFLLESTDRDLRRGARGRK